MALSIRHAAGRVSAAVAPGVAVGVLGVLVWAAPVSAQTAGCIDGLAMLSPDSLTVLYELRQERTGPIRVPGNYLRWSDVLDRGGTCATVFAPTDVISRLGIELEGRYVNAFDRDFVAAASDSGGVIGSPTAEDVIVTVDSSPPNPAAKSVRAVLNLSNAGGIYRMRAVAGADVASQRNVGVPEHLSEVNVTAFAVEGQRIYAAIERLPVIRSDDGGETWMEPSVRLVAPFATRPEAMVVAPGNPDRVMIAARGQGLWVSNDAGATWSRDLALTPDGTNVDFLRRVTVRRPDGTIGPRVYLGVGGGRLLYSDDGVNFLTANLPVRLRTFVVPGDASGVVRLDCNGADPQGFKVVPRSVAVSAANPSRIFIGVDDFGVFVTEDDHATWTLRSTELIRCDGNIDTPNAAGARRSVQQLFVLKADDGAGGSKDILIAYTGQPTIQAALPNDPWFQSRVFVSVDGGGLWQPQSEGFPLAADGATPARVVSFQPDPRRQNPDDPTEFSGVLAATATRGMWQLNLGNTGPNRGVWVPWEGDSQIRVPKLAAMTIAPSGLPDFLVGTSSSGVYELGDRIDITRAVNSSATPGTPDAELPRVGLSLRFNVAAPVFGGEGFTVRGQAFQAYAVWRATRIDETTGEPIWQMIGLRDLTNPESCSPQACDERDIGQIVGCFADKRANCFTRRVNRQSGKTYWEFFDRDVYNGFSYRYAVSTLDYGFTGNTQPQNQNLDFVFSPRSEFESDPAATPYVDLAGGRNYNFVRFDVNVSTAADLGRVYVVPNPLVRRAGFDVGDEASLRIVNVTASSKVQIFTLAGDLVRELENVVFDGLERGNIAWDTRNGEGEEVASGVYIYRVTDDDGNEYVDRLTIIR